MASGGYQVITPSIVAVLPLCCSICIHVFSFVSHLTPTGHLIKCPKKLIVYGFWAVDNLIMSHLVSFCYKMPSLLHQHHSPYIDWTICLHSLPLSQKEASISGILCQDVSACDLTALSLLTDNILYQLHLTLGCFIKLIHHENDAVQSSLTFVDIFQIIFYPIFKLWHWTGLVCICARVRLCSLNFLNDLSGCKHSN